MISRIKRGHINGTVAGGGLHKFKPWTQFPEASYEASVRVSTAAK